MISVVVPVHDEEESLIALHGELDAVFAGGARGPVEFIFVDDGSRDGSWGVLTALAERDPRVHAIRFRRNFGKAAALTAAFGSARGDLVFTLDGDLQDDPAEIPRFLARARARIRRGQRLEEDAARSLAQGLSQPRFQLDGQPRDAAAACTITIADSSFIEPRCCARSTSTASCTDSFPVLAHARGFRVAEVEVRHRRRQHGVSKYGVSRLFKGFLDLMTVRFLTRFSQRPLHVLGGIGLTFFGMGSLGML